MMFRRLIAIAAVVLIAKAIAGTQIEDTTAWVCPMHSDYTADVQGTCPRCGMALVHAAPFDVRDYRLDMRTVPAVVRPGQKASLFFRILRPGTTEVVNRLEEVEPDGQREAGQGGEAQREEG